MLAMTIRPAPSLGRELTAGAYFDPATRMVHWTPGERAAGIYRDITYVATDGINTVTHSFDLLVGDADRNGSCGPPRPA